MSDRLYTDLMALEDPFYFSDLTAHGRRYRSFSYRVAPAHVWSQPGALEARGHTFDVTDYRSPKLAAMPMPKFFNLRENEHAPQALDPALVMEKLDGSLVMTCAHPAGFVLKTKMSTDHDSVPAAEKWLTAEQRLELFEEVVRDRTVCMEWTSPRNRIVVEYDTPQLTVLCVRDHATGEIEWCPQRFMYMPVVQPADVPHPDDEVEGVVVVNRDGSVCKVKTDWYRHLHRLVSGGLKATVEAVLANMTDGTPLPIHAAHLHEVKEWLTADVSDGVAEVNMLWHSVARQSASRKDWALACKTALPTHLFALAMKSYANGATGEVVTDWLQAPGTRRRLLDSVREKFSGADDEVDDD